MNCCKKTALQCFTIILLCHILPLHINTLLTIWYYNCAALVLTYSQPVWMMAPLSEVILIFLWAMTKRTKPRRYQSHSGREIRRSSLCIPATSGTYKSKREGVAAIHHPAAAVFNSINKKAPASECLSVPVTVFDNHFWAKALLYSWGKPEKAAVPPDALPILNPFKSKWNTGCIPRWLCPIWLMNLTILLLLATGLFTMNGFTQRCQMT